MELQSFQVIQKYIYKSEKIIIRINPSHYLVTFLLSGWDDSRIRGFYPESGHIMFTIDDAHRKGVTAVTSTSDCRRLVSGGGEGQVRVWNLDVRQQMYGSRNKMGYTVTTTLVEAMKEHTNAVSTIRITNDDKLCVSASADGTCIIWDLRSVFKDQGFHCFFFSLEYSA